MVYMSHNILKGAQGLRNLYACDEKISPHCVRRNDRDGFVKMTRGLCRFKCAATKKPLCLMKMAHRSQNIFKGDSYDGYFYRLQKLKI